jgi:hypothetical protein
MRWAEMDARGRDALIAATVLGQGDGPLLPDAAPTTVDVPRGDELPPYAREVGAAWRVVERLNDRTLPDGTRITLASLDYATAARAWHAAFQAATGQATTGSARAWTAGAWSTSAADAICQAALLVLDYDLDALPAVGPPR